MTMEGHRRFVGWLHVVLGAVDVVLALLVFGAFTGVAAIAGAAGAGLAAPLAGTAGLIIGGLMAITALPNLLAGWGLLQHRSWGRLLALVLALLNVFKFPWGTILAAYTFWVLTDDSVEARFQRG